MHIDVKLPATLGRARFRALRVEGYDVSGVWSSETTTDPFLLLGPVALDTSRVELGTAIAVALARSPFVVAQAAWELQATSDGRFHLGLGTQVQGHLRDRFSAPHDRVIARLEDYVSALRALWRAFQEERPPRYRGRFYNHTALPSTFNPGPISNPRIPIWLGGANLSTVALSARVADGFLGHPLHGPDFLRDEVRPRLERPGVSDRVMVQASAYVLAADDPQADDARRKIREAIAFIASTARYEDILITQGFPNLSRLLRERLRTDGPSAAGNHVPESLYEMLVVDVPAEEIGRVVRDKYGGLVDRVLLAGPHACDIVPGLHIGKS